MLIDRIEALATAAGALIKSRVAALRALVFGASGSLADLPTTDKTSIVASLIEIYSQLGSGGLTETQVQALVADAIADLVGTAPGTLDTIQEIAAAIGTNEGAIATLTTAIGNRVRYDAAQSLTGPQQAQARANINAVENVDTDFVAQLNAAAA
jgi:hypothetical protein